MHCTGFQTTSHLAHKRDWIVIIDARQSRIYIYVCIYIFTTRIELGFIIVNVDLDVENATASSSPTLVKRVPRYQIARETDTHLFPCVCVSEFVNDIRLLNNMC